MFVKMLCHTQAYAVYNRKCMYKAYSCLQPRSILQVNVDVRELKENHPEYALLLETKGDEPVQSLNLTYTKVPVHDLEVGSHILVRAGEAVPVDGEVYQGSSTVTIEHLTGETKPLERTVGDAIPGGARNLEGMMIVKVTKSWEDSTLNRIVQLTAEGQLNKPKL